MQERVCDACGARVVEAFGLCLNVGIVRINVWAQGEVEIIMDDGRRLRGYTFPSDSRARGWVRFGRTLHESTCTKGERAQKLGHTSAKGD